MSSLPLSARQVLDRYFFEVRCKLLEIAATLDRIDRADDGDSMLRDSRREAINEALDILGDEGPDRAERVQMLFSRPYDPNWANNFGPMSKR